MSQHGRPRLSRARTRPVAAMAVLSTRSGQMASQISSFGLRMADFILSRIRSLSAIFRKAGKANGNFSKARQPQWPFYQSRWPFYQILSTMAALSRSRTRPVAAVAVLSSRSGQIARSPRFGLRIADFILPRVRSLSAAKPSHFYQGLAKRLAVLSRPASRSGPFSLKGDGRFIKAGQPQ